MPVNRLQARIRAREMIARAGVSAPPVPVDELARQYGIIVEHVSLDDEISGMAFIKEGHRFIIVNSNHHINRQRFTLAHELAHHILHYEFLSNGIHVDKTILKRDHLSGLGTDSFEIAANAFAAEFLIPEKLIKPLLGRGIDLNDDEVVERLAATFRVSTTALNYRLTHPAGPPRQGNLF